ncbi:hypothetical protein HBI17_226060 [Parastagonospora nodorum]|nr:hypothetical protein HBH42_051170 [Parastagonospora nodorum]KAH5036695.1 hypothetical protein HBI74_054420 [Parastagonospora nodorum]KAH5116308.1 hypothetical protein HBH71_121090 [Parastagonospora nodorum]KAH5336428.1 hypothetical protein HBI12_025590 [Parastagonospora nodorum]KAH5685217.1 hypothetical protein HBI21_003030 [Parastagonospora nodorum]
MPTRTHSVRFPTFARKPRRIHDPAMQIAPGIFADSHEAERQFFLSQASQMQLLANSAGVKQGYRSELKGLKKDLKATRARRKQDTTGPSEVTSDQIKVQIINAEDRRHTEVIPEASRVDIRDAKITELEDNNARLKSKAKTLTEERDRLQNMHDTSELGLVDIITKCTEMQDQQVEQGRLNEEKFQREKAKFQEQLTESDNRLKTERSNHDVTRQDFQKSSAESVSKQLALDESASALHYLKADHEFLGKEYMHLRHQRDSLKDKLEEVQCENETLRGERDLASKTQADAAFEKDEQLKATKLELESALAVINDLREVVDHVKDSTDIDLETDDTLIGDELSLHGESSQIKVEPGHSPVSDTEPNCEDESFTTALSSPPTMNFDQFRVKAPIAKLDDRVFGSTASNNSIFGNKQLSNVDPEHMVIETTKPFLKFASNPAQNDDSDGEDDSEDKAANISDVEPVTLKSQASFGQISDISSGELKSVLEEDVSSSEGEERSFGDSEDSQDSMSVLSNHAISARDSASSPSIDSDVPAETRSPSGNFNSFADLIKASKLEASRSISEQKAVLHLTARAFPQSSTCTSTEEPIRKPEDAIPWWNKTPLSSSKNEPSQPVPSEDATEPLSKPYHVPEKFSVAQRSVPDQSRPMGGMMSSKWAPQNTPYIPAASQPQSMQSQSKSQHLPTGGLKRSMWASGGANTKVAKQPPTGGRRGRDNNGERYPILF